MLIPPPIDSPPDPDDTPDPVSFTLSTNQFDALLAAVKELNGTMGAQKTSTEIQSAALIGMKVAMEGIKETLDTHTKKFDILTRDAEKDDKAYDPKPLGDDSICSGLYEIALAKTREKVEEWNGRIDVTLIFIALFSAVLTAFLVPATQALTPSVDPGASNSTSNSPPPPPPAAERICALYYLSLITAIIIAVLCVLGRQWVRKCTVMPESTSWMERTIWHTERMERSEWWITTLMESLYWLLLSSIGLFIAGLLYQLDGLASSFQDPATILLATWGVGVVLASGIIATMGATTYHAVRYQGSVFEGLFSKLIVGELKVGTAMPVVGAWMACSRTWAMVWEKIREIVFATTWTALNKAIWTKILQKLRLAKGWAWFTNLASGVKDWTHLRFQTIFNIAWHGWGRIGRFRIQVESKSMEKLLDTYLHLIAEASDPKLLERAVGSFSYATWVIYGGGLTSLDALERAYSRLMATDTSIRVRETVNVQIGYFALWIREREAQRQWEGGPWVTAQPKELEENSRVLHLTEFLLRLPSQDIYRSLIPTHSNIPRILELLAFPFDQLTAHCLCINDQTTELGDHDDILNHAMQHCDALLNEGKSEVVMQILSYVDRLAVIRSSFRARIYRPFFDKVVRQVIRGHEIEIVLHLCEFLKHSEDWSNVDPDGLAHVLALVLSPPILPSRDVLESEFDPSPIFVHLLRHPPQFHWRQASDVLVAYLDRYLGACESHQYDTSQILDQGSFHRFLQLCLDGDFAKRLGSRYQTSPDVRNRVQDLMIRYQYILEPVQIVQSAQFDIPRPSQPQFLQEALSDSPLSISSASSHHTDSLYDEVVVEPDQPIDIWIDIHPPTPTQASDSESESSDDIDEAPSSPAAD
ncbi:hypothetical protein SISSUDRAFT_444187 [Sistotremastrum suecicum HHB10207 ss-3]|uniref:DUF6535 domain-containing protein n=1 Tax=Sistotremastrum suecicum HHB10207 ss-3 TaxID=1314776 RepID=A0A165YC68_9AGAM|nr:hypothetical protein SISSUDRAFT_444187 [Sistotremastrum suecicum HHB10207 ss-3]